MMQCTQCSCHAPSGGQQIQQLVGRSDFKCVIERSGRCVKELEILRHFQSWGCLYKAWSCSRSGEEPAEIREREHRRASESERGKEKRVLSTSLCECVVTCDCAIAILDHLEFVACSSRSTVRLCGTPGTFITVIRATALLNDIQES